MDSHFADLCWDCARHDDYWGGDNPQPIIRMKNFHINTSDCSFMGSKNDTIKIPLNGVNCMIFRNPELVKIWSKIDKEIIINCIGKASINTWQGRETI